MGVPGTVALLARCLNFRANLYGLADITTHHYKNPCEKKMCLQLSRFMDAQICSGAQRLPVQRNKGTKGQRNKREEALYHYCHQYFKPYTSYYYETCMINRILHSAYNVCFWPGPQFLKQTQVKKLGTEGLSFLL